jgi:hypothetical protein
VLQSGVVPSCFGASNKASLGGTDLWHFKLKLHDETRDVMRYFLVGLLGLIAIKSYAFDVTRHNDWVCFVNPFDLSPENRINVLGSVEKVGVLQVGRDGKTLKNQRSLGLREIRNIDNTRSFGFSDGTAMAIVTDASFGFSQSAKGERLEIKDGWHPAIYYKGHSGGGFTYRCKPVQLTSN